MPASSYLPRMSPPIQLPNPWKRLAAAAGGLAALSQRVGVHERTLRRWANGSAVSKIAETALRVVCEELGVPKPRTFKAKVVGNETD